MLQREKNNLDKIVVSIQGHLEGYCYALETWCRFGRREGEEWAGTGWWQKRGGSILL